MKKPSEEAIRAEAENYAQSFGIDFKSPLRIKSFIAGAKWAISQMEQDDVIEKVKELRDKYDKQWIAMRRANVTCREGNQKVLTAISRDMSKKFVEQLNAIIEKP